MEVKNVYSDMHSLRKLYGHLLQSNNNSDDTMDEQAQLLLKNLLDNATEGLFQAVSKIIAVAQSDVSDLSCPLQPMQPKMVPHLEPSVATNGIQASPCASQGFKLDSDFHASSLLKDDQYLSKPNVQNSVSEISVLNIHQQKPSNIKKRCRVCQEVPVNGKGLLNGKEKPVRPLTGKENTIKERKPKIQTKPGIANSVACHSVPQGTGIVKSLGENATGQMDENTEGTAGGFSGEVANAIKRIEMGILTLQLLFQDLQPVEVTGAASNDNFCLASSMQSKIGGSVISRAEGDASKTSQRIQNTRQIFDRFPKFTSAPSKVASQMVGNSKSTESTHELLSQSPSQNVKDKAILGRIESLSPASSQYVHGLRIPLSQDGMEDDKHSMHLEKMKIPGKSTRNSLVSDLMAHQENKGSMSQMPRSVRSTSSSHKYLPSHQTISPTLLDYEPPPLKHRDSGKHMITKGRLYARPQHHKILQHQQESEERTRSSHQQTKSSSSSSSYNGDSLSSGMSKMLAHVAPESSTDENERSNDSSHSMASYYKDISPQRRHIVRPPNKTHRSRSSLGKPIGRLRKFKNKLGLIFHHHHHHHHHERLPTTSNWKNLHKKLRNEKQGTYEKQAIQKSKTQAVGSNQIGNFHMLVQGLMRHVKHSKKSRPSKSSPNWKGNVHHDHEWRSWQMFRPRRGVKVSTKGHVKLGFLRKNPRLRAPR